MQVAKSIVKLSLTVAVSTLVVAATSGIAAGKNQPKSVQARLVKVQELRRATLVAAKKNSFDFHKPGLELTFAIQLPDGMHLIDVEQPAR